MNITHRQIEVFHAIMTSGSITAAAQRLNTSQPTLSRELQRLEQVLEYPLFERKQGKIFPTARGLQLFDEVDRSWQGMIQINSFARSLRAFGGSRLEIGVLPALASNVVPLACQLFCKTVPDAVLHIKPLESPWLEEGLSAQRFDLGLVEQRQSISGADCDLIFEQEEVCILPDGHPLLAKVALDAEDFLGHRFVSLAANDPYRLAIDQWFHEKGVERKLQIETTSAASVCALVQAGQGVAILNPLSALEYASRGIQLRRLTYRIPFQISVVKPHFRPATPLISHYEMAIRETMQEMATRLGLLLNQT